VREPDDGMPAMPRAAVLAHGAVRAREGRRDPV